MSVFIFIFAKTLLKATEFWQNSLWTTKPIVAPLTPARFSSSSTTNPLPEQFSQLQVVLLHIHRLRAHRELRHQVTTLGHTDQPPWQLNSESKHFSTPREGPLEPESIPRYLQEGLKKAETFRPPAVFLPLASPTLTLAVHSWAYA